LRVRHGYRFGSYRLDATDRLLYKNADLIALPPKVFDTLLILVTNHGHVVGKDEMLKQLWPDSFVEDGTLTQYISLLRKALGDEGKWVENLPRRGYRFMAPVEEFRDDLTEQPAGPGPPRPVRRLPIYRIASLAVVLIVITAGLAWWYVSRPTPIRSIAVLPFLNLSGDSKLDYISDGLTDELTHALTRLQGIRVVARTSAFQFRGKNEDVRKIGEQLNVAGLLEGSVRLERNNIRVTAQFIDARTGHHVWSETYDGSLDDLLSIQQQIGVATVRRLAQEIRAPVTSASGLSRDVFLSYLQGRYFLARGRPETFRKAADLFKEVTSRNPEYARAHSGLADTYYRWALWESFAPAEAFSTARRAAEQAIALDETLAEAHASLANVKFQYDWDYVTAEREYRRSIALDPHRADTWHWFSHFLTATGRFNESLDASNRAIELEPFDLPSQNHLGWCYYFAGEYDRAIKQHRRVLELDPSHGQTRLLLGRALLQRGDFSEAIEQLRRNLELSPDSVERLAALAQAYATSGARKNAMQILNRLLATETQSYVSAYSIAGVYAALGAREKALAYLEKAAAERSSRLVELKYDPIFKTLRSEPSFQAVLKRIGL
jgi:TolB-like protein/DNA-binding winged helix-turn-helix (wHTH) protein/cytochrome c-type biogenesis protein CcmH/NrfG